MRIRKPSILEANIIYLALGILLISVGYLVQAKDVFSGLLITEYVLILLPNIIYLKLRGYSLKGVLRLNPISLKQTIIIVFIMLSAYPIAVFLNALVLAFFNNISSAVPATIPIPTTPYEFIIGLFIIGLSPGICEEVMFRGTMLSAYERLGYKKCILITSILFGIFHFNAFNFIGPTFLGIILGIIVYKTNSIFSSILGHFINNSVALSIGYFITKNAAKIDEIEVNSTYLPESTQVMMSLVSFGIIAIISSIFLIKFMRMLPTSNYSDYKSDIHTVSFNPDRFKVIRYIPVAIIVIIYVFLNYNMLFNV